MRLRVCAVYPCHCSGIWCSAWAVVSCCVTVAWLFCGRGDTLVAARETQRLPALRGSNHRVAAPATLFRPPGRPCRKESQTFGLISFRIPWIASAVGCQSTHARLRSSSRTAATTGPRVDKSAPGARDHKRATRPPCLQKAPGTRDHCRATSPRVCKSSWNPRPLQGNWPPCLQKVPRPGAIEGNRPSSLEQVSLPETAAGQPAPASTKAAQKLEHLGTTSPTANPELPV